MKREFLEGLKVGEVNLTKEVIDSIMAEHGKTFTDKDEKIQSLTTEKDGLSTQLADLNTKVKDLSKVDAKELQTKLDELDTKYKNDTTELNTKLSKQNYEFKIKELTSGLKFSSESAKKAFITDLSAKELKLEEDKLLGYDDYVKSYQESDPNAFTKEEPINKGITVNTGGGHEKIPTNTITSLKGALVEKYN